MTANNTRPVDILRLDAPEPCLPPALRRARLKSPEASLYLSTVHGVIRSCKTLDRYRSTGGGPEFERLGRSVYYRPAALDAWVAANLSGPVASTSEADTNAGG